MGKDCKGVHMDAIGVSVRFLKEFLTGCHQDFFRILKGFKRIMKDFYKDFKRTSRGIL